MGLNYLRLKRKTMNANRAYHQTPEEWLQEYKTGVVVEPTENVHRPVNVLELVFDHHRTARTKSGSVILCFVEVATGQEYLAFFNADLNQQRGSNKGQQRKIGQGGQFLPPKRGKFRKFWMSIVGTEPKRWSTVHKDINARLKDFTFTGDVDKSVKADGTPFNRIKNVTIFERQKSNNFDTYEEQLRDIPLEQRIRRNTYRN